MSTSWRMRRPEAELPTSDSGKRYCAYTAPQADGRPSAFSTFNKPAPFDSSRPSTVAVTVPKPANLLSEDFNTASSSPFGLSNRTTSLERKTKSRFCPCIKAYTASMLLVVVPQACNNSQRQSPSCSFSSVFPGADNASINNVCTAIFRSEPTKPLDGYSRCNPSAPSTKCSRKERTSPAAASALPI